MDPCDDLGERGSPANVPHDLSFGRNIIRKGGFLDVRDRYFQARGIKPYLLRRWILRTSKNVLRTIVSGRGGLSPAFCGDKGANVCVWETGSPF